MDRKDQYRKVAELWNTSSMEDLEKATGCTKVQLQGMAATLRRKGLLLKKKNRIVKILDDAFIEELKGLVK
jgi:hypothetical protein